MKTADSFLASCNMLMCGQSPRAILRRALQLIEEPQHWTPWANALDVYGRRVRPQDPTAVCWSVENAISRACGDHGIVPPYFMVLLDNVLLERFNYQFGVTYFEQHRGHDEVKRLLMAAIDAAPGEEA